jgi:hypothetical protein
MAEYTIKRGTDRVHLGRSGGSVQMDTQCNTRYRDKACMDHGSRTLGKRLRCGEERRKCGIARNGEHG